MLLTVRELGSRDRLREMARMTSDDALRQLGKPSRFRPRPDAMVDLHPRIDVIDL